MKPQQQSLAISAGLCGVAALAGAPAFIVAAGCGLLIRECFRDPAEYEADTTVKDYSQIKHNKIRF
jgi:polysaccharide pyruvyl transferase WcaK-like protein